MSLIFTTRDDIHTKEEAAKEEGNTIDRRIERTAKAALAHEILLREDIFFICGWAGKSVDLVFCSTYIIGLFLMFVS